MELQDDTTPLREAVAPPPVVASPVPPKQLVRIWCCTILAITLPILAVAAYLKPNLQGTGSHEQIGLPPCGWYQATGHPCMTCGCTTAVTHVVHGQIVAGFITQPFGAVFGVATVMAALLAVLGVVTGKWFGPEPFWIQWHWRGILLATFALLLLAWWYKVAFVATAHG